MTESELESKDYTLLFIVAISVVAISIFGFSYYMVLKSEKEYYRRNKQCYEELTLLIDRSSMQKSKWIENTILAEKHALGSTSYCWILDLVQGTGEDQHPQANDGIGKSEKRDQTLKKEKEGNNGRLSDH